MKAFKSLILVIIFIQLATVSHTVQAQCATCKGFTTYTQGGWGATPKGNNPGAYLEDHFVAAFGAAGVTIGAGNNTITFTTAASVTRFLPQGGTPAAFNGGNVKNLDNKNLSVLAGQLLAATLNVRFDSLDADFGSHKKQLNQLVYNGKGSFNGKTVDFILQQANAVFGGVSNNYTPAEINTVLTDLNENYDNGTTDKGLLICPLPQSPAAGARTYCIGETAETLIAANNNNLRWYTKADTAIFITQTLIPNTDTAATYNWYVTAVEDGCESKKSVWQITVKACYVSSGATGGTESRSLGDIITQRVVAKAKANLNGAVNYAMMQPTITGVDLQKGTFGTSGTTPWQTQLDALMPKNMDGLIGYYTSPKDLTTFTNAQDVVAIDFTKAVIPQAVVFATQTKGELYNHSKAVCDRLKGATVQNMDTLHVNGFILTTFELKAYDSNIEHVCIFTVGAGSQTGNRFLLQSHWLANNYVGMDVMNNFQVWCVSKNVLRKTVALVLQQVANVAPIKQSRMPQLPNMYMVSGNRVNGKLHVVINNSTAKQVANIQYNTKANEHGNIQKQEFQVAVKPFDTTEVVFEVKDMNEIEIIISDTDQPTDWMFMSDGSWALSYSSANTQIKRFAISNNPSYKNGTDAFYVNRTINVKANTSDYVSLYKVLKGGGTPVDLSAMQNLHFRASGGGQLLITLIKNNIANWNNQYTHTMQLNNQATEYDIPFNKLVSSFYKEAFNANDVTAIVLTVVIPDGKTTIVNNTFSDIAFTASKKSVPVVAESVDNMRVFPNPATTQCNVTFNSIGNNKFNLVIREFATGKCLLQKNMMATAGKNTVAVNDIQGFRNGLYVVELIGEDGVKVQKTLVIAK